MASGKAKKENIITITVVAFAVLLSLIVILVKTGVIGKPAENTTTEQEYVSDTRIVIQSRINEDAEVEYYSIEEWYNRPLHSSNHRYPTTTTTKKETTEDEDVTYFIEEDSVVNVTDENGEQVTNENGEPVTKIEKVTIITDKDGKTTTESTTETTTQTTSERTTKVIYVTDPISKKPIKNIKGEYIVSGVETEPETTTTTKPSTTKATTTTKKPSTTAAEDVTSSTTAPKASEN